MSAVMGRARRPARLTSPSLRVLQWMAGVVQAMPTAPPRRGPSAPPSGSIEATVLAILAEGNEATAKALAERTGLPRQQVRNALYRLRNRSLVSSVGVERVALPSPMPAVVRVIWGVRKHPPE